MKYYLIEIAEGDAKIKGKAIYEYDNITEATANYHKKIGTAMSSDLYIYEMVMIIDENGNVYKSEVFKQGE